jgi:GT2 family glycosyltransferase/glycosyltransferase involved in cell wall biosynthesis
MTVQNDGDPTRLIAGGSGGPDIESLQYLWTPELAPLFWPLARVGVSSAWYTHVPFAHWIVRATRPRSLVELGTHNGVSYSAFCEAVIYDSLETRCYAVDTWKGDEHSELYGEEVYWDLWQFHESRYGAFSQLLRCSFDAAAQYIPDQSVDLLHIDGLHTYEAVRHDFEQWRPKLSERAVVLLHDTNVREREFGVWRLWEELSSQYPSFEFLHGHGLGVLQVGTEPVPQVVALCGLRDQAKLSIIRKRFSLLGERWLLDARERLRDGQIAAETARRAELEKELLRATGEARDLRAEMARRAAAEQRLRATAAERTARARAQAAEAIARASRAEERAIRAGSRVVKTPQSEAVAQAQRLQSELRRMASSPLQNISKRVPPSVRQTLRRGAKLARSTLSLRLGAELREWRRRRHEALLIRSSSLFDASWYMARYPDVAAANVDPLVHYVKRGGVERRDPGPNFSTAWYLQRYPDVNAARINPLVHYLAHGAAEGREIRSVSTRQAVRKARTTDNPADGDKATHPADEHPAVRPGTKTRIVYLSGEPDTPGNVYRVVRHTKAAAAVGAQASWMPLDDVLGRLEEISAVDVLVIWRAAWNEHVAAAVDAAHRVGARVVFDLDDLMMDPDIARLDIIDGIRTQYLTEDQVRAHYARVQETLRAADYCTAATPELASQMRRYGRPVLVLPNGFDHATYRASRLAVRRRRVDGPNGLVRIGYAAGSRTHQRDFAVAAESLARVLRDRPQCRLVLFYSALGVPVLDVDEFPALRALKDRIEWRDLVPLPKLPEEIARFDINIAPLEIENIFCEAKSELKFFEAALVDVPTIASPTGPMRRAIRDCVTGFLAARSSDWDAALLRLVDEPDLRRRVARAAQHEVLWRHGPLRRASALASALLQFRGEPRDAARDFELGLHRARMMSQPTTVRVPEADVVFEADQLDQADVTVVIPLHNYAHYIEEALDSALAQTVKVLDVIVIDDASTDDSLKVAVAWARRHAGRFNRIAVLRNRSNVGLGPTRNTGIDAADTPFVMLLDADNRLLPSCCEFCLRAIEHTDAAFAYPKIRQFGDAADLTRWGEPSGRMGDIPFEPGRFVGGPYIDAMILISKEAWSAASGFADMRQGWEDFDFCCRLVERGLWGLPVGTTPLAEYRVHGQSMQQTQTRPNLPRLLADMELRHPWLDLPGPRDNPSSAPAGHKDVP